MRRLQGVGPATASAVLEAFDPSIPYASDAAMLGALGSKDYTVKKVLELTAALRGKAAALSEEGGRQWTARDIEMALYGASLGAPAAVEVQDTAGGSGHKRKR